MSVDPYAICPCGNGIKIKFCKCKESVSEMDQILTMIEGGQIVPALDKIKSILEQHPDAAWALAIRGRMFLDLREYASLEENAERFIRLQPSNPLALTQRAAALVFKEDLQGATDSLLEAMNESGTEVDSLLMDVALIVAVAFARKGVVLSARVFALLAASSYGMENQYAQGFLSQLDGAPGMNHLLKAIPHLIPRPEGVSWGERYDEAISLLKSNKVPLAQDKFDSLRRSAALEPAVLSGLFHCAVWRGDLERQAESALQLSEVDSLDEHTRWKYRSYHALISPTDSLTVACNTLRFEFEDADQVEMALIACDQAEQLSAERLSQLQVPEGEVPPRSGFQISDRPLNDETEGLGSGADAAVATAMVLVFGRQTDRSAQAIAFEVLADRVEDVRSVISTAIGECEVTVEDSEPIPISMAFEERPVRPAAPTSMAALTKFNREFATSHEGKRACEVPLSMLGGRSLAETAQDDSLLFERSVIVRLLEGQERLVGLEGTLDDVYQLSGIAALPELTPNDESAAELPVADYFRVNPSQLSGEVTLVMAANARTSGALSSCRRFAQRLIELSDAEDADHRVTLEGYAMLMTTTPDPAKAIETADIAIEFAKRVELPFSHVLLAKLELSLSVADQDLFRGTVMDIEKHYGNDPSVMAHVQQLLVQIGLIRPDGSLRNQGAPAAGPAEFTPAPAPASNAGVWTPDSAPPKPEGEGGGKLWIPGMD
ncbi:MAG: protein-disulfide isomerase [Planctomycetota bacterium]